MATARRRVNPIWQGRMMHRRLIRVHRRLTVEPAGPGKERLSCKECGWSMVQNIGGMTDDAIARSNPQMMDRLVKYRGHAGGIAGICDGCTEREREARYPLAGIPRYR